MKIGLIGCGGIASWHAKVYRLIENATIVAVCDKDVKKARVFANEHKIEKTFESHLDLLEIKDLDFVDVCTPTSTHASITVDAVKSGINVLSEKPMALKSEQCDQIISETKKHKAKVCVCHNQIFFPVVKRIKSMIDDNRAELVSFKTFIKENGELLPSWTTTASEGGILWEAGYHLAYLQLFFLRNITSVFAIGNKVKYPVYDDFCVLLKTPSRSYGIMEISWLPKKEEIFYEVDTADGRRYQMNRADDHLLDVPVDVAELAWSRAKFRLSRKKLRYFRGHFYLFTRFMDALKNDLPSPIPPEDGKKTIQLLESIQKSLERQEIVQVLS
ncbi:MAG: Gfo/Idh/MocA family oxidoreductase [Candidatus Bathyarchaeia archaeon]